MHTTVIHMPMQVGSSTFSESCRRKYSPMNPFFANSRVNLLVIFSSSCSLYSLGLSLRPAFPPPNGTSTHAHLKVISADKAFTSSRVTSSEYRIPATYQVRLLHFLYYFFRNNRKSRNIFCCDMEKYLTSRKFIIQMIISVHTIRS